MKKIIVFVLLVISTLSVNADNFEYRYGRCKYVFHPHNESSYQHAYCQAVNEVEEYENIDKTRVDCLTEEYAIEFDFANKYYEAIGQALHYAVMTDKKPKVVLILDKKYKNKQMIYFERVKRIGETYNIDVDYISDDILNLDEKGKCRYKDCKCNKNRGLKIISQKSSFLDRIKKVGWVEQLPFHPSDNLLFLGKYAQLTGFAS